MLPTLDVLKKDKIVMVSPDKILPNPNQPRKHFDEKELFRLSDSISQYGIIQPITVRQNNDSYEIICGERRLRAAVLAGLVKVPCIIKKTDSKNSAAMALTENLLRKNLNFFEEAGAISELIESFDMTQEEIAVVLGKTQGAVANKLRLLKLSPAVRSVILENYLTERHARLLLNLEEEEDRLAILKKIIEKKMNVATAEAYVDEYMDIKSRGETPAKKMKKFFPKDIKIFINTINHAVSVMKKSGIKANAVEKEEKDYIEYIITIPKPTLT